MMNKFLIFMIAGVLLTAGFGAGTVSAQKKTVKKTVAASKVNWSGMWSVPSRFYGATLTINRVTATQFEFELEANNGANTGSISGTASIKGRQAFFDDRKATEKDASKYGCRLTFTHKGTFIDIQETSECDNYAGNAVYFTGEYQKNAMVVKESDLVALEVFPDKKLDAKFRRLVGTDYELFLESFHLIGEDEDADGFGAKVFSACVRGMCPWNAGIIMYDAKGNFWAAVMNVEGEGKSFAHYYTNVPVWTDKLPKTIEKWVDDKRSMNDNLTVVFKSK
jgi:hypothetical protein